VGIKILEPDPKPVEDSKCYQCGKPPKDKCLLDPKHPEKFDEAQRFNPEVLKEQRAQEEFAQRKLSLTDRDRMRRARINSPKFDITRMNEGGPMFKYVGSSSHNSRAFTEGYERTFGKQDMFKNLMKEKKS